MKAHRAEFSVCAMCRVLRVSRSGFYGSLKRSPSRWETADRELLDRIRRIHAESRGIYGAPRIQAALRRLGVRASRRRIGRLMASDNLRGVCRRRRRSTTRADGSQVAADLVQRKFQAERPDELWVADATYVPTAEGTLYLAAVQDVFSRRIVGWSMASRQTVGADGSRRSRWPSSVGGPGSTGDRITRTTDRSTRPENFRDSSAKRRMAPISMGSVGDCYDNAMAESFFATLETGADRHAAGMSLRETALRRSR